MIAINSNCARVDLVKAQAGQLKIQAAATSASGPAAPAVRKVKTDLQTLDTQIKTGDAKKAELALATTERDVQAAQTASPPASGRRTPQSGAAYGGLDVYA
jgi:hypothetical protein